MEEHSPSGKIKKTTFIESHNISQADLLKFQFEIIGKLEKRNVLFRLKERSPVAKVYHGSFRKELQP